MPTCPNCGSVLPAGTLICDCGTTLCLARETQDENVVNELKEELRLENAELFKSKAKRLEKDGEYLEAIEQYYNALALQPDMFDVYQSIAESYFKAGMYDEAMEVYHKRFNYSNEYKMDRSIADALFELGRYGESIEKYWEAIRKIHERMKVETERDENDRNHLLSRVYNDLGWAYNAIKDYDAAIECYEEAIGYDYNWSENWNCKAIALENKGMYVEALKFYDIAIEMNPNGLVLRNNRESCLKSYGQAYRDGGYTEKSDYLDEALELTEDELKFEDFEGYGVLEFDED